MAVGKSKECGGAVETDASCHSHLESGETHMGKEQEANEATEGAYTPSVASITSCFFPGPPGSYKPDGSETTSSICPGAE